MHGYTPLTREEALTASRRLVPACLIIRSDGWYYAFSPDGKLLAQHVSFSIVDQHARFEGYAPVSSNSKAAALIRDDFRKAGYGVPEDEGGQGPKGPEKEWGGDDDSLDQMI